MLRISQVKGKTDIIYKSNIQHRNPLNDKGFTLDPYFVEICIYICRGAPRAHSNTFTTKNFMVENLIQLQNLYRK